MRPVALLLVLLSVAAALSNPGDVGSVGMSAEMALLGLDDEDDRAGDGPELGDAAPANLLGTAQQEAAPVKPKSKVIDKVDAKKKEKTEKMKKKIKFEHMSSSSSGVLEMDPDKIRVEPNEITPALTEKRKKKIRRVVGRMIMKLKKTQTLAVKAHVLAKKYETESDMLQRMSSVKEDKQRTPIDQRELVIKKQVRHKRGLADKAAKKAEKMKLAMKEQIQQALDKSTTQFQKAHFAATAAEIKRAQEETARQNAMRPKPMNINPCDIALDKQKAYCFGKTEKAKLKEDFDETDANTARNAEKMCLSDADNTHVTCKKAQVSTMSANAAATATKEEVNSVFGDRMTAQRMKLALQTYKDVETPKTPDGPVGLFQHQGLVFFANKDGTRTWIKYPTLKCHRATAHVVPQQFPKSADKPELDKSQSATACEMGVYKGVGNPDFYTSCECSGSENKKGHGGHCDSWGYKFNWCYVVSDCGYGQTAFSEELKDTKVMVGCKIHAPAIEP